MEAQAVIEPRYILRMVWMYITCSYVYPPIAMLPLLIIVGIPLTDGVRALMWINAYLMSFLWGVLVDKFLERKFQ